MELESFKEMMGGDGTAGYESHSDSLGSSLSRVTTWTDLGMEDET